MLIGSRLAVRSQTGDVDPIVVSASSTTMASTTTQAATPTTSIPPSTTTSQTPEEAPAFEAKYVVPPSEVEPEQKQLAVDIAYELTTYDETADHAQRLRALDGGSDPTSLIEASEPLIHDGSWSRGEVIYPQMGGLTDERASVMVVTRQTVGQGSTVTSSLVRTIDIRLEVGPSGWEFDHLSSAGGTIDGSDDLTVGHEVAADPRIEMPDSARLDILANLVSPTLLEVMAELADVTPYGVVVLASGHPHNVFETERLSHHTIGQAVDIYRIGDSPVIEDRAPDSETRAIVQWLYDHPDVLQVGSPWDLDGPVSRRSFTNTVHQDHIHVAVDG